jgi:thymidylate synthase (FAD)
MGEATVAKKGIVTTDDIEKRIVRKPLVQLVGFTGFRKPDDIEWKTDTPVDGERIIEFGGRMCYQSWRNPAGRTNAEYIGNMLDHGHLSVLEHAVASFRIEHVSRSCTHEIVRHRHFSYSQLSQRFVSEKHAVYIEPTPIAQDPEAHALFVEAVRQSQDAYNKLYRILRHKFDHIDDKTLRRKKAREAARSVLPNATETKLVMTGNFRAWRHFCRLRGESHTDVEIRAVAIGILRQLKELSPAVFGDFEIYPLPDGTEGCRTEHVYE